MHNLGYHFCRHSESARSRGAATDPTLRRRAPGGRQGAGGGTQCQPLLLPHILQDIGLARKAARLHSGYGLVRLYPKLFIYFLLIIFIRFLETYRPF